MEIDRNNEIILIVVAHTDDETFGMGGTIIKHANLGDSIFGVSLTNGVSSRDNQSKLDISNRRYSAENASKILGLKWFENANFPDNELDKESLLKIVKFIEKVKNKLNPTIIYTHSAADLNIDHRIVANAVLTAFRPLANETFKEIRAFEIPSATDYGHKSLTNSFNPNLYVDISETIEKKIKAIECYSNEIKDYPNSRSIQGITNIAKYRGNQVGLKCAEAFEILRRIER